MTIDQVNRLPRAEFVEQLGWVFEHSPWVAERAWVGRLFASIEALHAAMTAAVEAAPREQQLALLRAHPELGSRAPMSHASTGEQAGAGFDSLDATQRDLLPDLLRRHREKFAFPFLYAVRGSTLNDIFTALAVRLESMPEEELHQALHEAGRIAWFRLQDQFKEN
jgi:2-oxo-4-hydroxy-4-carboxy-5-ureidoimidazoline decarboxylase